MSTVTVVLVKVFQTGKNKSIFVTFVVYLEGFMALEILKGQSSCFWLQAWSFVYSTAQGIAGM